MEVLQLAFQSFGANTPKQLLLTALVGIACFFSMFLLRNILTSKFKQLSKQSTMVYDDAFVEFLRGIHTWFLLLVSFAIALRGIVAPPLLYDVTRIALTIACTYLGIKFLEILLRTILEQQWKRSNAGSASMPLVFHTVIKFGLWLIGLLLILSNVGVNVTSLIAGLGIGGLAISLAVQNILSDLFSSFSIAVDKPFKVGDFIVVGEHKGTVKHIGLKTTRITSLQGEEIVISNGELTSARVQNFKKMQQRRVAFNIRLPFDTPVEKINRTNEIIKNAIEACEHVEFSRCHFSEIGDSFLLFEAVYVMTTNEYDIYMDTKQKINLTILEEFKKEGIMLALPTNAVWMKQTKPGDQ